MGSRAKALVFTVLMYSDGNFEVESMERTFGHWRNLKDTILHDPTHESKVMCCLNSVQDLMANK